MAQTLSPTEIDALLQGAPSYRSKIVVRAEPVTSAADWATVHGDSLHANAGDWWVIDGENRWSVAGDVFAATYEHIVGDRYRKVAQVTAVQLDHTAIVESMEGAATGMAGDWLVRNPSGECWPVPGAEFARRYEEA